MRLAFMGTPDFAVPALAALLNGGHEIAAVYTQPPRPAGRGKKLRPSPVQLYAEKNNLDIFSPASLKDEQQQAAFAALKLDAAVVVAYGLILPPGILAAPRLGCINIHASLLPRWRGAAPIQRAIMAEDRETGISVMQMDKGLDTGPVITQSRTAIAPHDTAGSLHDRLSELGANMICDALEGLRRGKLRPEPQSHNGITYAEKIQKEEGHINWDQPARTVNAMVRGLTPHPGAWFEFSANRIKVLGCEIHPESYNKNAGVVVSAPLTVACRTGSLALNALQREGKSPMTADELLRGFPIPLASRLE